MAVESDAPSTIGPLPSTITDARCTAES